MTAALGVAAIFAANAAEARERVYLLSLRALPVKTGEYINAFSIDTWGVRPLATCRIPAGWTITAGSSADPSGTLSGEGSLGATWLDHAR